MLQPRLAFKAFEDSGRDLFVMGGYVEIDAGSVRCSFLWFFGWLHWVVFHVMAPKIVAAFDAGIRNMGMAYFAFNLIVRDFIEVGEYVEV